MGRLILSILRFYLGRTQAKGHASVRNHRGQHKQHGRMQSILPLAREPAKLRPSILEPLVHLARGRKRVLTVAVAVGALSYLLVIVTHFTLIRDIGYLTRPIWDSPERPWQVINHHVPVGPQLVSTLAKEDYGALHGWRARPASDPPVRLIDAILISTELNLLEMRMREYPSWLDTFVVLEADKTFSGEDKAALYQEHRARIERLIGRENISHEIVRDLKSKGQGISNGSFENEVHMRQRMSTVLSDRIQRENQAG